MIAFLVDRDPVPHPCIRVFLPPAPELGARFVLEDGTYCRVVDRSCTGCVVVEVEVGVVVSKQETRVRTRQRHMSAVAWGRRALWRVADA